MEIIAALTGLIFQIGLTLGVGSSTFALIFYIQALRDGTIDPSEKRLMHTVYTVLRIGMILLGIGLLLTLLPGWGYFSPIYLMQWTLLGVITLNAVLMTYHVMPMKYGPILAGGSWYSLLLVTVLPLANSYLTLFVLYVLFVALFYFIYNYFRKRYAPTPQAPKPTQ